MIEKRNMLWTIFVSEQVQVKKQRKVQETKHQKMNVQGQTCKV